MTHASPATPPRAAAGDQRAVAAAVVSYLIWGLISLLFIAISRLGAEAGQVLSERVLWSVCFALPLVLLTRQGGQVLRIFRSPRALLALACSAAILAINSLVYIWAVTHGRNLESSLGYYINPLLNMAVGAVLFREHISRISWIAISLAAVGVAVQTAAIGAIPVAGLALAATFCTYGVIRKRVDADAQSGLLIECLLLAAPAAAYMAWAAFSGHAAAERTPLLGFLLLLTGPATVVPLVLFAWAARRMPYSTIGFIQFIGPTIQFCIGLAMGEVMTPLRALSFVFIWGGVAVFVWGVWQASRTRQRLA
jgi:chloramphenicol-sensitive protein RarD